MLMESNTAMVYFTGLILTFTKGIGRITKYLVMENTYGMMEELTAGTGEIIINMAWGCIDGQTVAGMKVNMPMIANTDTEYYLTLTEDPTKETG